LRRLPVKWRLTLAFAAVMALLLAATGAFVYGRVRSELDAGVDQALRSRAADVAALAQQADTGLSDSANAGVAGRVQLAQVIDARGRLVDKTPNLTARPLLAPAQLARARSGVLIVPSAQVGGDHRVRLLAAPADAQGQRMVIVVGQSLEERDQALSNLMGVLLLGGPVALALASLAGYALTGFALRPVHEAMARERTFVSDASHELRSPLAVLRTELELLARERPTGEALQDASRSAIEETDRLTRLADDLLLLARADDDRFALARARVPASALVAEAIGRARWRAAPGAPPIAAADDDGVDVDVDRERVAQALDNLLDNALRHASGAIAVTSHARDGRAEIHVLDDGPGFPPDFLPQAWERFSRADAARTDGGAGLGLSIVRTIAELHGGAAGAANRPGGGADVWIALPLSGRIA
jgi:two-component system OmpR family sensor kinase